MNKSIFSPKLIVTCALLPVGLIYVNAVGVKATLGKPVVGTKVFISDSRPNLRTDTLKQAVLKLVRGNPQDKFIYQNGDGKIVVQIDRSKHYSSPRMTLKNSSTVYNYNDVEKRYIPLLSNNVMKFEGEHFKIIDANHRVLSETIFVPGIRTIEIFQSIRNSKGYNVFAPPDFSTIKQKFIVHFHDDEGNPTESVFKITKYKEKVITDQASSSQMGIKKTQEFKKNNGDIYRSYFEESKEDGSMVTKKLYPKNSLEGGGYEMTEVRTDAYGNISGARYGVDGQLIKNIPPSLNVRDIDFNKLQSVLTDEERR